MTRLHSQSECSKSNYASSIVRAYSSLLLSTSSKQTKTQNQRRFTSLRWISTWTGHKMQREKERTNGSRNRSRWLSWHSIRWKVDTLSDWRQPAVRQYSDWTANARLTQFVRVYVCCGHSSKLKNHTINYAIDDCDFRPNRTMRKLCRRPLGQPNDGGNHRDGHGSSNAANPVRFLCNELCAVAPHVRSNKRNSFGQFYSGLLLLAIAVWLYGRRTSHARCFGFDFSSGLSLDSASHTMCALCGISRGVLPICPSIHLHDFSKLYKKKTLNYLHRLPWNDFCNFSAAIHFRNNSNSSMCDSKPKRLSEQH